MDSEAFEVREPLMLVSVGQSYREGADAYEAARYAWKVDAQRARRYDLVLAHSGGVIVGAFRPDEWLPAMLLLSGHFPGRGDIPGRWGFVGREAEPGVWDYYVGKRVPDRYRRRGAANPIRYCPPE